MEKELEELKQALQHLIDIREDCVALKRILTQEETATLIRLEAKVASAIAQQMPSEPADDVQE